MSATDPMHLSEAELRSMTADLDGLHHDIALPALKASLAEWSDDIQTQAAVVRDQEPASRDFASRRRFLAVAGGVAGAGLLAACSSSSSSSSSSAGSSASASGSPMASASGGGMADGTGQALSGDLQVVAMAASLENSGIATYMAGIKAATAGKLGTVPPAVVTFATTAMSQHQDHQKAWNAVLTAARKKPVTAVDPVVQPTINTAFAKVTTVAGLAELALMVEDIAGQTYQNGLSVIKSSAGIKTAASIQPVEFQHAAILSYVLGRYPVPNAFTGVSLARPPSDYKV
ncbi:MAG TPA: ferritin-like domain-containing protein [Trebonia sp.]|nr:ferritin-like domain-containing protein [Trebonia sp.]